MYRYIYTDFEKTQRIKMFTSQVHILKQLSETQWAIFIMVCVFYVNNSFTYVILN